MFPDDFSLSGMEEAVSGFPPSKDAHHGEGNFNFTVPVLGHHQKIQISGESFVGNSDHISKIQPVVPVNSLKSFVSHSDVSSLSVDEASQRDGGEGILDNCGMLHNNCLPFLVTTVPTTEKRKSLSSSPPNSAKKASLKLSFKRKSGDGHPPASACERFLISSPEKISFLSLSPEHHRVYPKNSYMFVCCSILSEEILFVLSLTTRIL